MIAYCTLTFSVSAANLRQSTLSCEVASAADRFAFKPSRTTAALVGDFLFTVEPLPSKKLICKQQQYNAHIHRRAREQAGILWRIRCLQTHRRLCASTYRSGDTTRLDSIQKRENHAAVSLTSLCQRRRLRFSLALVLRARSLQLLLLRCLGVHVEFLHTQHTPSPAC